MDRINNLKKNGKTEDAPENHRPEM